MLDFGYYNMNCMKGMKEFPDKYFDLAIVDPPYGINACNMNMGTNLTRNGKNEYPAESTASKLRKGRLNSGSGKLKNRNLQNMNCDWDFHPPKLDYFLELFRVSRNQIIWGYNYYSLGDYINQNEEYQKIGLPPTRGVICWDKVQPWENFSQFELAWTSFDKPASIFRFSNTGGSNEERKIHPTQKPIALYEWILSRYANPGDSILDTHVGSASSLIACHNLGFDYVGFEIDEYYYQTSKERLESHMAQLSIFDLGVERSR